MEQKPWFMNSGLNRFHHDQTMDDLSNQIRFLRLLNQAHMERIRLEWTRIMLSEIRNRAPNGYLPVPLTSPAKHQNAGIGPNRLTDCPCESERHGTGVYIPNYYRPSNKNSVPSGIGNAQLKQPRQPTKATKEEEKDTVLCHISSEVALPKEWTY